MDSPMHGDPTPDPASASTSRRPEQRSGESENGRPFGISNVLHRVGAPPLRQLPLETMYLPGVLTLNRMFGEVICKTVKDILTDNGVAVNEFEEDDKARYEIVSRCEPDNEDSAETTILIVAPWQTNAPDVWHKCVREIKRWVDSYLDKNGMEGLDVSVEMVATELVQPKYSAPVLDRPDLDNDWEEIKANIRDILGRFDTTKGQWDCIALFRFGPNEDISQNSPTVYISLNRECPEVTWSPVRNSIQNYLDSTSYGLSLHIEHSYRGQYIGFELEAGRIVPDTRSPLVIETEYTQKVGLGADIGAGRHLISSEGKQLYPSYGTLGCYIELKLRGHSEWTKFALTNYNVIRPAIEGFRRPDGTNVFAPAPDPQSQQYATDHNGFMPHDTVDTGIESPSRIRHHNTIRLLNAQIEVLDDDDDDVPDLVVNRDERHAFFEQNNHPLGTLFAGSGFCRRTVDNGMLDWALIKVEQSRIGENTLPDRAAWSKSMWAHIPPSNTRGAQLGDLASANTVQRKVFKFGAATQGTTAAFSKHPTDVVDRDWRYLFRDEGFPHATEATLLPVSNCSKVASDGDSGSIVYDASGRSVGMLYGGSSSSSHAYVTPLMSLAI